MGESTIRAAARRLLFVQSEKFVEEHGGWIGDSLLTQRLAGEIRVADAECIVGRTV